MVSHVARNIGIHQRLLQVLRVVPRATQQSVSLHGARVWPTADVTYAGKRGSVVDAQRFFRRVLRRGAVCFRAPVQAATRVDIEIATALRWAVSYRSGPP